MDGVDGVICDDGLFHFLGVRAFFFVFFFFFFVWNASDVTRQQGSGLTQVVDGTA